MDTTQDAVGTLKQFNSQARKELKALQKKLSKVKQSSVKKEQHKIELKLRRRETIEKLRISNQEHELLSRKVLSLRKELRNEDHAKLILSCQKMVTQYVHEIQREQNEGYGPGATQSTFSETKTNRTNVALMDEKDTSFHDDESKLIVGDVMLNDRPLGHDAGESRHTLMAHTRGTELTGLSHLEVKDDDPGAEEGSSGGSGGGGGAMASNNNPQSGGSGGSSRGSGTTLEDEQQTEFDDELLTHERWMKSRQRQLMNIKNDAAERHNASAGAAAGGSAGAVNTSGRPGARPVQHSVNILYEEKEGLQYKCQLAVLRGFTFAELVEEACAHWGLSSQYTFLEDPHTGAIWPASALVTAELPLDVSTPLLKLVFREHMSIADLIAQSHRIDDDDNVGQESGGGGDDVGYNNGNGETKMEHDTHLVAEDLMGDDIHNPSLFHPHTLERMYRDKGRSNESQSYVQPKYFVYRTSWLVRDFVVFVVWFVLMNIYITSKRDVSDAYWLNQAFERPLLERDFVSVQTDYVPKLNAYGAVPTEVESTSFYKDTPTPKSDTKSSSSSASSASFTPSNYATAAGAKDPNRFDSYRWYQQLKYGDIHDASQWWMWVTGPLVDLLYGPKNTTTTNPHIPGYLREGTTQLLGKLRFRQLRVKPNRGCTVSYLATSLYSNCYGDFDSERDNQDTSVFTLSSDTKGFTWSSGGGRGQSTKLDGVWSTYPGDGFVLDMDYHKGRDSFLKEIARLRLDNWLDVQTRAVVVELTGFSATHNLYVSTHFILEQSSSGLWTTSSQTWTSTMSTCYMCASGNGNGGSNRMGFAIDVAMYVVTAWVLFSEMLQLLQHCQHQRGVSSYCVRIWSLQQHLSVIFFLCSIITRSIFVTDSLQYLNELWAADSTTGAINGRQYYDLTEHMRLMAATTTLEALAIVTSALRLFQYMQRHSKMNQFTHVFVLAGTEIVFFSFMFSFTFLGFGLLGHNIYGSHLKEFSTLIKTFRTLIKMMVGDFDYESMRQVDQLWTPFFFFFYIIFVFMILVNIFLAILNTSYTNVREVVSAEKKRMMKTKELRPKNGKHQSSVKRAATFMSKTFGKKAFLIGGIYRKPEDVKREMDEKIKLEAMSSNPWIST